MTWHMGHPLSQSLFTSAYLDRLLWPDPKTLEQARFERDKTPGQGNELLHLVLRAYCLGLLKTCDFVRRTIMSEHYYEVSPNLIHAGFFVISRLPTFSRKKTSWGVCTIENCSTVLSWAIFLQG